MSEATTGVPAANASVRTIPNDSPPSDGAHSRSAPRSARSLAASSTRPSAITPWPSSASSGASSSAVSPMTVSSAGTSVAQRLEGAQQHRQPLALDGLADEGDPQRLAGRAAARRRRPAVGHDDAVGDHAVAPAVEAPGGPLRRLGHRDPHAQVVELAARAEQRRDHVRRERLRMAVERADNWRVGTRQRVPADDGRDRLVDVHDVERARRAAPGGGSRSRSACPARLETAPLDAPADRAPERHQPLGHLAHLRPRPAVQQRGPAAVGVERREHAHVVPGTVELDRERLDVARDAAGVCPRIRGDEGDPHAPDPMIARAREWYG